MKKLLIFLLTLFLLLVSCGNGNDAETTAPESTEKVTEKETDAAPESSIPDGYKVTKFVPGVYHAFDEELGIYTYPSAEVRKSETEKLNGLTLEFLIPEEWWTYDDVNAISSCADYCRKFTKDDYEGTTIAHTICGVILLEDTTHFDENFHGLTLVGQNNTDFPDGVTPMYDPSPLRDFQDGDSIHTGTTAKGYEYVAYGSETCPFFCYVRITEKYVILLDYPYGGYNEEKNYSTLLNSLEVKDN